MREKARALVLVEGGRLEPNFFERIEHVFDMALTIIPLECNIYELYKRLKNEEEQYLNIKDVVKELDIPDEEKAKLTGSFAYTYLVLDCDIHANNLGRDRSRDSNNMMERNLNTLRDMMEYFHDETDDTIGKLYVNYPMMESFRDCESPFEESYCDKYSNVALGKRYKAVVTRRGMNKNLSKYSADDFEGLMRQNIFKANLLLSGKFEPMTYVRFSDGQLLIDLQTAESKEILKNGRVSVLNTSLFLPLDYFGNRNGFYDKVIGVL